MQLHMLLLHIKQLFLKHITHEFFVASMSMELSNQKKLSEFYEELKRLNIEIVRPDINTSFANFFSDGKKFFMV